MLQHYQQLGGYVITPIQPNLFVSTLRLGLFQLDVRVLYPSSKPGHVWYQWNTSEHVTKLVICCSLSMEALTEIFFL